LPSATALRIGLKAQEFIARELTRGERLQCEELALNLYPRAVIQYIDRLIRRKAKPNTFSLIYQPARNMVFRYSHRRNDWIYMRGRMLSVYQRVGEFCGDGFSESELDAIVFLVDDCSPAEIDTAITYARGRGIHSAAYLKACILGNRKRYTLNAVHRGKLAQYIPDVESIKAIVVPARVPRIDKLRDLWRFRVRKTNDRLKLIEAELNARRYERRDKQNQRGDTA